MDGRYLGLTLVIFLLMSLTDTVSGSQRRRFLEIHVIPNIDKLIKEDCILCNCFQECLDDRFQKSENDLCPSDHDYNCSEVDRCTCCNDPNHRIKILACHNGGTCHNEGNGHFSCICPPGVNGSRCEYRAGHHTNTGHCAPHPCFNMGTCINHPDRFECQCKAGWTGETCKDTNPVSQYTTVTAFPQTNVNQHNTVSPQNPVNHCAVNPCFNDGTCIQLHDSFSCRCKNGWTGEDCNTDVDECFLYHPCKNGGTCINTPGHLTCQCSPGWSGGQCQTDIDECLIPNACQNGGTCTNAIGNYNCQCKSGFIGAWCETGFPKCNHTCALDAVILSRAIGDENHNCTDGVHFPDDILPKHCCNITGTWTKGNKVQPNNVCTDSQIPPYTPIAAFTNTTQVPNTSGIFYGCIKNGQSGFLMIHQNCSTMPQLLTLDSSSGLDPNSFFVIY